MTSQPITQGRTALRTRMRPITRHVVRCGLALGLVLATSLGTAGAASAGRLHQQTCVGQANRHTICLYITDDTFGGRSHYYRVHVGIDVNMTQQEAQNIIDARGDFTARLYGSDWAFDDNLQGVTRTSMSAWEGGLSADFDRSIWGGTLDEDPEGEDDVYARVSLYVPVSGDTRTFTSDTVHASFFGGSLGP